MFVIPCKFTINTPFVIDLVKSIREYHPNEKIVVVDSASNNKSYFNELSKYQTYIMDINNKFWMIGAYWEAYKRFPNEDYYFFMHDSMKVKANMDYLKSKPLTTLMYFERNIGNFNAWGERITNESKYIYKYDGSGLYACSFFCQNFVMKRMLDMGADRFLPTSKVETGYCEGCYGFFLEEQGFDLNECSLYGNVFFEHSSQGRCGLPPHKTSWQFPIEKFYGYNLDKERTN